MFDNDSIGAAEKSFRDAFERLKTDRPERLPARTVVSQNNVAKEAGRDPSALRKSRYPNLIKEIQEWVSNHSEADPKRDTIKTLKSTIAQLKERVAQLTLDRDLAQSLLVQAHDRIVVLSKQNAELAKKLPPSNVISFNTMLGCEDHEK